MKSILAGASLLALIAGGAIVLTAASEVSDLLDDPDTRWRRGPVRYLLETSEDKAYKKLKSEEDRIAFIAEFWKRRDPTPDTEENEFKEMYAGRLDLVMEKFGPPKGMGWEDDRGKAVALLGPPDKVEMVRLGGSTASSAGAAAPAPPGGAAAPAPAAGGGGAAPLFRAKLTFEKEPYPGAPSPLVLEFRSDSTGAFRMIGRFDFAQPILTGLEPLPFEVAQVEPPPQPEPPPPPPEPEPEPEPPAPPTPGAVLLDEVLGEAAPEATVPVSARLDFYKTKDAGTFATVTLAVDVEQMGDEPIVAARFIKEGEEESSIALDAEDSFAPAEENDAGGIRSLVFQAGHNLEPGEYSLAAAIKDPDTGKTGMLRQKITSPDFHGEEFQLSTVTLTRRVEPLASAPPEEGGRFVLGNARVLPAAEPVFMPGEEVGVYFQIYNTSSDPETGKPSLRVTYKFELLKESGPILLGGKPISNKVSTSVQAYALPISAQWPAGDYQIQVKVEDLVAQKTATAVVPFSVEKPN